MDHRIWNVAGTLLFCLYIVLDTQLMLEGKEALFDDETLDLEVFALNIYLDIIHLFLCILMAVGSGEQGLNGTSLLIYLLHLICTKFLSELIQDPPNLCCRNLPLILTILRSWVPPPQMFCNTICLKI